MFDISWPEFLVLIVAGLFILGPERLPGAAAWLGRTARQVRDYASGAQQQLRKELGPEIDELRKPLHDLQQLRNLDPRRAVSRTLLDATGGYDPRGDLDLKSILGSDYLSGTNGSGTNGSSTNGSGARASGSTNGNGLPGLDGIKPNGYPLPHPPRPQRPLTPGERPPFDPDAT